MGVLVNVRPTVSNRYRGSRSRKANHPFLSDCQVGHWTTCPLVPTRQTVDRLHGCLGWLPLSATPYSRVGRSASTFHYRCTPTSPALPQGTPYDATAASPASPSHREVPHDGRRSRQSQQGRPSCRPLLGVPLPRRAHICSCASGCPRHRLAKAPSVPSFGGATRMLIVPASCSTY